jgi:hypothetical protein
MSLSFLVAIIIEVLTIVWCGMIIFADGMSDSPSTQIQVLPSFIGGTLLAVTVAASHFIHMSW